MWSSNRRDLCIRSVVTTAVSILCISLVYISWTYRGTGHQMIEKIFNENSISAERLVGERCIPVCDSKDCVIQADILLKSVNTEVDPCDNFQTFLCGAFEQRFGQDENGLSGIRRAHMMMLNKMKESIENIHAPSGSASSKLKIMYDSCVNTGSSDLRGVEDFKEFLGKVEISNWPYLSTDFAFSEDGLSVLLGTLTSYLEAMLFGVIIKSESLENSNETYVQASFRESFVEFPTTIQRHVAADILKYFDIGTKDIELILNDYNNVKNTLLRIEDENLSMCEEDCESMHIDCLSPGDEDWVDLCKTIEVYLNLTHLNDIITKPGVFVKADDLFTLKTFISTLKSLPNRSVANFFALKILWNHLDEINLFFRRKKQQYYKFFKVDDLKKPEMQIKDRWIYCIEWIEENMKLPLEKIYVEKYLDKKVIDEIHDMHTDYTSEIADMFAQQEWIPMELRYALDHWIRNLENKFSHLQKLLPSEALLDEYMKLFSPTSSSFLLNVLEERKSKVSAYWLYKIDPTESETPSFKVNAAYSEDGEIVYHYGIVFPPFHYPGHNSLINRVLFAPIVVHEIGHGVVMLLNKIIEMPQSTNITKNNFLEKQHCIENQFSNFEFKYLGGNLNGTQYFEENLSDNLAQTFLDKLLGNFELSHDAISLPGLLYSPTQQLYMSSGEAFCSKSNLKLDVHFKTSDVHAPMEYRIIGTMQNSRGYSEAFQCPAGSYMNPTTKCSIFD